MKSFWKIILCLLLVFLTGCGVQEADPNRLTGIYAPVLADIGTELTAGASGIYPLEDGYGYVLFEHNLDTRSQDEPYRKTLTLFRTDETGAVISEVPLPELGSAAGHYIPGEKGIYTFSRTENGYELFLIGWDGSVVQHVDSADFKPGSANTQVPEAGTLLTPMPLTETGNGLAIVWGKRCVLLDETFTETGEIELPGKGDMVFAEGDTLWLTYLEDGIRTLGKAEDGVITESWPMPERFCGMNEYYWARLIDCRDGWLYGWQETGIIRWQFGAKEETIETVMDFINSGISGQTVRMITMLPDGRFSISLSGDKGYHICLNLYEKAPDKDLSEMTVLTLACVSADNTLEEAVLRFNAAHEDAYIKVVSYQQYNTADEPVKGYRMFRTDLTTGILQADILSGEVFEPLDLYSLMTGDVQPEDIAPCVRRQYETENGALPLIGPSFALHTLAGRADALDGLTHWDLETFLDFAENLEEGEYLMEDLSRYDTHGMLFHGKVYEPFIQGDTAAFDDPLYARYLRFLMTLPEQGQKYMDHGTDNTAQLFAGEITEDQLHVEEAGENLYYNGRIKLTNVWFMNSVNSVLNLNETFGTNDLTFIGYPTEEESGVDVNLSYSYSIPSTCKDPALAWEFIEDILLAVSVYPETETPDFDTLRRNLFGTLQEPYFAHLESLKGLRIFRGYSFGSAVGWDLELDANGCLNGQPGILQEIDDDIIALIRHLYDTAGSSGMVSDEIYAITYEEESRFLAGAISAEECADNVQSRMRIYLAEHE